MISPGLELITPRKRTQNDVGFVANGLQPWHLYAALYSNPNQPRSLTWPSAMGRELSANRATKEMPGRGIHEIRRRSSCVVADGRNPQGRKAYVQHVSMNRGNQARTFHELNKRYSYIVFSIEMVKIGTYQNAILRPIADRHQI